MAGSEHNYEKVSQKVSENVSEKCPEKQSEDKQHESYGLGVRHVQIACMCATLAVQFIVRSSMGVAVLAMTDETRINDTSVTIYDWDKKTQGVILSSFFWGYVAMQLPAGLLAKRFGGKPILTASLLLNGATCLLVPTFASVGGWGLVCVARMCMGLGQACLFPCTHTLLGRWLPPRERTTLTGVVYGGAQLGIIISMPLCGWLASMALGWRLIFYTLGVITVAMAALWHLLTANCPAEHRLISPAEASYVERNLRAGTRGEEAPPTPYRQMLTSAPVWALVIAHIGTAYSFVLFFVDMPTYLEKGIGISLRNSASLSALPYVGMWTGSIISTAICERIYNRGLLSLTKCRKLFNSIGMFGSAILMVGLSFVGPENKPLAVGMLVAVLTINGSAMAGFMVNHLDLSPNYAGLLLSLTNFSANILSIGTPIFTSLILRNDPTDVSRWRIVFLVTGAVGVVTDLVFVVWGSGRRQPWDPPSGGETSPDELVPIHKEKDNLEKNEEVKKPQVEA